MTYFAVLMDDGQVLRVDNTTPELAAERTDGCVLADWPGRWPVEPHPGAELVCIAGVLSWRDPRTLEQAKADRWAAIKARRQELDQAPISLGAFSLDANDSSRMDLMGAIMAMQITGEATRDWRCSDNVMRELTAGQIVAAGVAVANRRQTLIETSDTLSQAIDAATTHEAVAAIVWPG